MQLSQQFSPKVYFLFKMKLWILHVSPWSLGTVNDGEKTISLINCHQITGITSNSNSFKYHLILSKERSILLCELLISKKIKLVKILVSRFPSRIHLVVIKFFFVGAGDGEQLFWKKDKSSHNSTFEISNNGSKSSTHSLSNMVHAFFFAYRFPCTIHCFFDNTSIS